MATGPGGIGNRVSGARDNDTGPEYESSSCEIEGPNMWAHLGAREPQETIPPLQKVHPPQSLPELLRVCRGAALYSRVERLSDRLLR